MIGLMSLRWVLTAAFVGTAAFHLLRCLRQFTVAAVPTVPWWVSEALHVVMSGSMIVMVWPWGAVVPKPVWVAVFLAATGWFVAGVLRSPGRRLVPGFFATAMAAMVWMSVSMRAQTAGGAPHAGMAMAGMGASPLGATAWISGVLGAYLVLAAAGWLVRGMRVGGLAGATAVLPAPHWPAVCHGVMSAGMGLALLSMT